MGLLLEAHPTLLSRTELASELKLAPEILGPALERFGSLQLVHRLQGDRDEFYWSTRTAIAAARIDSA